jgi:phosphatidylserine synthase
MKQGSWMPNALTMGNLSGGMLVAWSMIVGPLRWDGRPWGWETVAVEMEDGLHQVHLYDAGGLLSIVAIWLLALLCDLFDGPLARKLGTAGPMGVQLDSMADLVTAGVAPALVGMAILSNFPDRLVGWPFLPWTMVWAAAFRLARFNVEHGAPRRGFKGMPAPAGAVWWMGVLLLLADVYRSDTGSDTGAAVLLGALFLGSTLIPGLMVSSLGMMDFKEWGVHKGYDRSRWGYATVVVLGVPLGGYLADSWGLALLSALLLYVIWSLATPALRHPVIEPVSN